MPNRDSNEKPVWRVLLFLLKATNQIFLNVSVEVLVWVRRLCSWKLRILPCYSFSGCAFEESPIWFLTSRPVQASLERMRSKGKFRTQRTVGGCDGCHSCEQTELCPLHRGLKSHGLTHLSCHQPTAKLQALIAAALELRGQCVDSATVPWHSQVPQYASREMLHMSALCRLGINFNFERICAGLLRLLWKLGNTTLNMESAIPNKAETKIISNSRRANTSSTARGGGE